VSQVWFVRDASWCNHPRTTGAPRIHLQEPSKPGMSRCGRLIDVEGGGFEDPPESLKCKTCSRPLLHNGRKGRG